MKLDEILNEWDKDCVVDRTDLSHSGMEVPRLHAKYYRMYANCRLALRALDEEYKQLYKLKCEYYNGTLDQQTMEENGWAPFYLKILKSEVDKYIDADKDIVKLNIKMAVQREKVDALESILKSIANRGYLLRTILDAEKFRSGM